MKTIKTGLAAFGMSGQVFHAPFIEANPNFELSVITERSKNLSQELYPNAHIVRSFDELLASDVELVIVNTPDITHFDFAKKALEAGKHVIVEKPFTTTEYQAKELIDLAKKKRLMLSVFQNRRLDSDFLTVKQIIDYDVLGRLVEFESTFSRYRNYIKPDTWKETGKVGEGLIYNLGSHIIDQALQLFGMPEAIFADISTLRTNGNVDDYFIIHLLHPINAPEAKITLKSSYLMCEAEPRFVLHGTEGSYVKYGTDRQEADLTAGMKPYSPDWGKEEESTWGLLHTEKDGLTVKGKYPSLPGNYGDFYDNVFLHLRCDGILLSDAEGVLPVIRLIEAAVKSSREQIIVQL